jgi:SAM-dependent methyltransferase
LRKTSREFWDGVWAQQGAASALDPTSPALVRHYDRMLDQAIAASLAHWGGRAASLIELGCGGSVYLPYFALRYGLAVAGLDYSDQGCARARAILDAHGAAGEIVEGDLFSPPEALRGRFDIVFSMGLLEHFDDTAAAVAAGAAFLRPGGLMLSIVPNMTGLPGLLQRALDPALYAVHVPLDAAALAAAHEAAGLAVLEARYLMTLNLYVLHYRNEASAAGLAFRALRAGFMRAVWAAERGAGRSLPHHLTSPYVLCAARAPHARARSGRSNASVRSASASTENAFSMCRRAPRPLSSRSDGRRASSRRIAAASASASPGGTISPQPATIAAASPTSVATTGVPEAIASATAFDCPSPKAEDETSRSSAL